MEIKGSFYFKQILEYAYKDFLSCFRHSDGILLLYRIFSLLSVCFSIREKYDKKTEDNDDFRGLKRFYNIIKHNYSMDEIIKDMIVPNNEEIVEPVFMPIQSLTYKTSKNKEDSYYETYVQGKKIKDLMDTLYSDTKLLFNK